MSFWRSGVGYFSDYRLQLVNTNSVHYFVLYTNVTCSDLEKKFFLSLSKFILIKNYICVLKKLKR